MLFADKFNVYVSASGSDSVRAQALDRLMNIYAIDPSGREAFLRGERVLLQRDVAQGDADKTATGLRAIGVRVDIDANRAALAVGGLDDFGPGQRVQEAPLAAPMNMFFDVGAGLVGLDGEDAEPPTATVQSAATTGGGAPLSMALADEGDLLRPTAATPPPPPTARPPAPPASAVPPRPTPPPANLFAPTGAEAAPLELALDRPPPTSFTDQGAQARAHQAKDTTEAPRCPTHDVAKRGGRCPRCEGEEAVVRGRLFGGKLHHNPTMRIGLGLGAGVVLGWLITMPMARRAEREVEFLREEARREHARPTDEAQAHARQLDEQADEQASSAFTRTLAIWAVIAAATTAGWHRLT